MSRLPDIDRAALTPDQRDFHDAVASGPRGEAMATQGPFGVWMHSPAFGMQAQRFGAHVRYGTSLPPRLSELAILICARHWRAQYEWFVHAPIAERAGVERAAIEDIRRGRRPKFSDGGEAAVYAFCSVLLTTRRAPDAVYAATVDSLGVTAVIELVGVVGYYSLVALTLNAFEVAVPSGNAQPFD